MLHKIADVNKLNPLCVGRGQVCVCVWGGGISMIVQITVQLILLCAATITKSLDISGTLLTMNNFLCSIIRPSRRHNVRPMKVNFLGSSSYLVV